MAADLGRARAYLATGNYASAKIEFEKVLRIDDLPHDLNEACDELEQDDVILDALGEHVAKHFLHAKREEWREYITQVHHWELERYLLKY